MNLSNGMTVLLVVAGGLLVLLVLLLLRKPLSPCQWALYYLSDFLARVVWRVKVDGEFPIGDSEGALIVSNHRCSLDPCIIQRAVGPRVTRWMVAMIYREGSLIAWALNTWGIIPVRRSGMDVSSTKAAIRFAQEGELVGMFPEGAINVSDDFMRPVRSGAALVALKAKVPILPCYIEGAPYHDVAWRPILMLSRVKLKIGTPIDTSKYHGREREDGVLAQLTLEMVQEIARLAGPG